MNERGELDTRHEGPEQRTGSEPSELEHITPGLGAREQVERTADRIRDELLLTLEELDRRRHRLLDVGFQASKHQDLLVGLALTAFALTSLGVGIAIWRARHREQILARHRLKALKRAWEHPKRLASTAEERPLGVELGRKLILIFGTALASNIAKNSVELLVPRLRPASARK